MKNFEIGNILGSHFNIIYRDMDCSGTLNQKIREMETRCIRQAGMSLEKPRDIVGKLKSIYFFILLCKLVFSLFIKISSKLN